jgi:4-hydroxy-tetrahydrodipicolinate synthase
VVVLGSNGEFPYLSFEEKRSVMVAAALSAAGRIPVIGTASASGTDEAVALAREARAAGCDAVMAALPLYFNLEFKGVVKHLSAIASEGGLPVIFYYFPEVTGLVLTAEELSRIAAIKGIPGAKITVVNRSFLRRAIAETRAQGWKVFTGTSFLLKDCLEFGGSGVFCPLPLIAPDDVKGIYDAYRAGDMARAGELQARVRRALPLFRSIALSPKLLSLGFQLLSRMPYRGPGKRSPAMHHLLKEALRIQGHPISNKVKNPFEKVSDAQSDLIKRTLNSLGWLSQG